MLNHSPLKLTTPRRRAPEARDRTCPPGSVAEEPMSRTLLSSRRGGRPDRTSTPWLRPAASYCCCSFPGCPYKPWVQHFYRYLVIIADLLRVYLFFKTASIGTLNRYCITLHFWNGTDFPPKFLYQIITL